MDESAPRRATRGLSRWSRRIPTFLVALFATIAVSVVNPAGAQAIYKGSTAADSSFGFAVRIVTPSKAPNDLCTGSLVKPNMVLTAAHCVYGSSGPSQITFHAGYPNQYTVASSAAPSINPDYTSQGAKNDVAILTLDRSVSESPIPLAAAEPAVNTKVVAAGYGNEKCGLDGKSGKGCPDPSSVLLGMSTTVVSDSECHPGLWDRGSHFCTRSSTSTVLPGDSGGPLIWAVNGVRQLAGVTSTYMTKGVKYNWFTSVMVERSWIDRILDLPPAAKGGIVFEQIQAGPPNYPAQLILRSPSGTLTNLSNVQYPLADHSPDVSPDGSRIVFAGTRYLADSLTETAVLMVRNSDGSGEAHLHTASTTNIFSDSVPRWSPNGQQIAYIHQVGNASDVWTMNADGSNDVQRTSGGHAYNVSWSPDGTKLVFDRLNPATGSYQLFIMSADGSDQHLLAGSDTGTSESSPVWAPNGRRIYFNSGQGGIWYYASADGFTTTSVTRTQLSTITAGPGGETQDVQVRVSSDSSALTFNAPDASGCPQIWTMSTSTAAATKLTDTGCTYQNYAPTFVPIT